MFSISRFRYIEVLFHISRLWMESRKSFTEDIAILVQYSNKFMRGFKFVTISHCFALFLIVMLLLFLLLCFVLYCCAFVLYLGPVYMEVGDPRKVR